MFAFVFESVGAGEWFVLLAVLLIVMGPKNIPSTLRKVGGYYGKFRRAADSFRRQLMEMDYEIERQVKEATADVKAAADEVKSATDEFMSPEEGFNPEVGEVSADEVSADEKASAQSTAEGGTNGEDDERVGDGPGDDYGTHAD